MGDLARKLTATQRASLDCDSASDSLDVVVKGPCPPGCSHPRNNQNDVHLPICEWLVMITRHAGMLPSGLSCSVTSVAQCLGGSINSLSLVQLVQL